MFTPHATPTKAPSRSPLRNPKSQQKAVLPRAMVGEDVSSIQNEQEEEGIKVAVRMRPLNSNENIHRRIWKVLPKYSSVAQTTPEGKPLTERVTGRNFFTYDKTFGEECSTRQVYENVAKSIVQSAASGLNGTIFAYGQTSSGKTYTMQGSGSIQQGSIGTGGIVHMAAADIFEHISSRTDRIFLVRTSFLEVYNEEVRDLLSNKVLQIREDPRRGVFVLSKEEIVTDMNSLLTVLFEGERSRAFASTAMNERSSRSHTIFRITIESRTKASGQQSKVTDVDDDENVENDQDGGDCGAVIVSTLNLVDLAGSESVRHTGATGDRQVEGGMINRSLLTLSRVIVALGASNNSHVNFRDSKLTRLLQPSLSGNARMAIICCATPSELYVEETRSTLQFATRAKMVKTHAKLNEIVDDRSLIRRLQTELAEARRFASLSTQTDYVKGLEEKAATEGSNARQAEEKLRRLQASILNSEFSLFVDPHETQQRPNKRRMSESCLSTDQLTPLRLCISKKSLDSPQTLPRLKKNKEKSIVHLSPTVERSFLRQANVMKRKSVTTLRNNYNKLSDEMGIVRAELAAVNNEKGTICAELKKAIIQVNELQSQLCLKEKKLQVSAVHHELKLKFKDNAINDKKRKIEEQQAAIHAAEKSLDGVQIEYEKLAKMSSCFENQVMELSASNCCMQLEKETLITDFRCQKEKWQTELMAEQAEKVQATARIEVLEAKLRETLLSLEKSENELHASHQTKLECDVAVGKLQGQLGQLTLQLKLLEDEKHKLEKEASDVAALLDEAKDKLQVSDHELQKSRSDCDHFVTMTKNIQSQNVALSADFETSKLQHEHTTASSCEQIDNLISMVETLQTEVEVATCEIDGLRVEIKIDKLLLARCEEELQQSSINYRVSNDTILSLQAQKATISADFEQFRSQHETDCALWHARTEELKIALSTSSSTVESLELDIQGMVSKLQTSEAALESTESNFQSIVNERDNLLAEQRDAFNASQMELMNAKQQIVQLTSEVQSAAQEKELLMQERDDHAKTITNLNSNLSVLKCEADTNRSQQEKIISDLNDSLIQLQIDFQMSQGDKEVLEKEAERLLLNLESSKKVVDAVCQERDHLHANARKLDVQLLFQIDKAENLEIKVKIAEEKLEESEADLNILKEEVSRLQNTLKSTTARLTTAESTTHDVSLVRDELSVSLKELSEKNLCLLEDLARLKLENNKLATDSKEKIMHLTSTIEEIRLDREAVIRRVEETEMKLEKVNLDFSCLTNELENIRQENKKLTNTRQLLEEEVTALLTEMEMADDEQKKSVEKHCQRVEELTNAFKVSQKERDEARELGENALLNLKLANERVQQTEERISFQNKEIDDLKARVRHVEKKNEDHVSELKNVQAIHQMHWSDYCKDLEQFNIEIHLLKEDATMIQQDLTLNFLELTDAVERIQLFGIVQHDTDGKQEILANPLRVELHEQPQNDGKTPNVPNNPIKELLDLQTSSSEYLANAEVNAYSNENQIVFTLTEKKLCVETAELISIVKALKKQHKVATIKLLKLLSATQEKISQKTLSTQIELDEAKNQLQQFSEKLQRYTVENTELSVSQRKMNDQMLKLSSQLAEQTDIIAQSSDATAVLNAKLQMALVDVEEANEISENIRSEYQQLESVMRLNLEKDKEREIMLNQLNVEKTEALIENDRLKAEYDDIVVTLRNDFQQLQLQQQASQTEKAAIMQKLEGLLSKLDDAKHELTEMKKNSERICLHRDLLVSVREHLEAESLKLRHEVTTLKTQHDVTLEFLTNELNNERVKSCQKINLANENALSLTAKFNDASQTLQILKFELDKTHDDQNRLRISNEELNQKNMQLTNEKERLQVLTLQYVTIGEQAENVNKTLEKTRKERDHFYSVLNLLGNKNVNESGHFNTPISQHEEASDVSEFKRNSDRLETEFPDNVSKNAIQMRLNLEELIDKKVDEHSNLQKTLKELEVENTELLRTLEGAKKELEITQNALCNDEKMMLEMKTRISDLIGFQKKLEEKICERDNQIECLKQQMSIIQSDLLQSNAATRQMETNLRTVTEKFHVSQNKCDQCFQALNSKTAALAEAQEKNERLAVTISSWRETEDSFLMQIKRAHQEKDDALETLRKLQNNFEQACEESINLKTKLAEVEARSEVDLIKAESRFEHVSSKLVLAESDLKNRTDEVIEIHDMLESSNKCLDEAKTKIYDLEDELNSKVKMYSQNVKSLEAEKRSLEQSCLDQRQLISELKHSLSEMEIEKDDIHRKLIVLQNGRRDEEPDVSQLQQENIELKQLLTSANERADNARLDENAVRKELETYELQLKNAYLMLEDSEKGLEEAQRRLKLAEKDREEVLSILEESESTWKEARNDEFDRRTCADCDRLRIANEKLKKEENEIKMNFDVEKRLLIQEAETNLLALRQESEELRDSLSRSEQEAYGARALNEELRDQVKRSMQSAITLDKRLVSLQNENATLKSTLAQDETKKSQDLKAQAELKHMLEEKIISQQMIQELRIEKESLSLECGSLQQKLATIESKKFQLEEESRQLRANLDKTNENLVKSSSEVQNFQSKIAEWTTQIQMKDSRIKKLEKYKLTKEHLSAIQKIKKEHGEYQLRLIEREKEIASLRTELSDCLSRKGETSETTGLRFEKNALETKLKKFAAQCQKLEDEKTGIIQILRSTQRVSIVDEDVASAVVRMCDRLVSLEQERNTLSKQELSLQKKVELLQKSNVSLNAKIAELIQQIEKMETNLDQQIMKQKEERKNFMSEEEIRNIMQELENRKTQITYLEQENLHLMNDIKNARRQLQSATTELKMLRVEGSIIERNENAAENSKAEKTKLHGTQSININSRKLIDADEGKENFPIKNTFLLKQDHHNDLNATKKPARRPLGLGDALNNQEENTGECKQS